MGATGCGIRQKTLRGLLPVTRRLQLEQFGVSPGLRHQFVVRAGGFHLAIGEHENAVAGEAVRDQDGGLAVAEFLEALEHLEFRTRIERRGRLVENRHLGLAHVGAGDGNLLPFATPRT